MPAIRVVRVTSADDQVRDLLSRHVDLMRASSPEESCHVMDPDALFEAGAVVFGAYTEEDDRLLGLGALKPLGSGEGELKSMHTHERARGMGIGARLLDRLVQEASAIGLNRVSLETGSDPMFAPARRLYARHGFVDCPPFGEYVEDPLSVFMTRSL